jgi:hypothetical protein
MQNHHHYEVKKGQMMPRHQYSAANSSRNTYIDSDTWKMMEMRMREVNIMNQMRRMISMLKGRSNLLHQYEKRWQVWT